MADAEQEWVSEHGSAGAMFESSFRDNPGSGEVFMTRIVVQHRLTGFYLKRLGDWTRHESEAYSFSSTSSALLFCLKNELTMAQIVMKFGEERYDIQLPVIDSAPERALAVS